VQFTPGCAFTSCTPAKNPPAKARKAANVVKSIFLFVICITLCRRFGFWNTLHRQTPSASPDSLAAMDHRQQYMRELDKVKSFLQIS